ncbi:hypothetical protein IW15_03790 [Chryseobacterium soli]|uniref:Uncharacterized protein n=1 Tax=Chryseobacterium soli TaxID=445961 RepID=A0A086AD01_9FLAO|nr:hypothetical protein IW15_03790 [Chryseobacterium soli]
MLSKKCINLTQREFFQQDKPQVNYLYFYKDHILHFKTEHYLTFFKEVDDVVYYYSRFAAATLNVLL